MGEDATRAGPPRKRYRTRNWRDYDRGLVARGDLTLWISPDLAWHEVENMGRRGRPRVFTDAAIQAVLTLKVLCQLPLRAAQGMAGCLIRLAGLDRRVPHYSTLSRRQKDLAVANPYRPRGGPLHLVIDSTGLKVLGEGEWKVRRHGTDKRRVWHKVHMAVNAEGHEVRAVEMTDHRHGDGEVVPNLIAQVPEGEPIGVISGDGAYDIRGVYAASLARGRPRRAAAAQRQAMAGPNGGGAEERNEMLHAVRHLGRRIWKRWSGYHRRSLAETAMSRLKPPGGSCPG